jgi:hypothetical protein
MRAASASVASPNSRGGSLGSHAVGKPANLALVSVMRKLLALLNAILRDHPSWHSKPLPSLCAPGASASQPRKGRRIVAVGDRREPMVSSHPKPRTGRRNPAIHPHISPRQTAAPRPSATPRKHTLLTKPWVHSHGFHSIPKCVTYLPGLKCYLSSGTYSMRIACHFAQAVFGKYDWVQTITQ